MAIKSYSTVGGMWGANVPSLLSTTFDDLYFHFSGSPTLFLGAGIDLSLLYAKLGVDITLNYELGFGLLAKAQLDTGAIKINYAFDPNATVSGKLETMNKSSYVDTSHYLVTSASISTTGLNLQNSGLSLDLGADFSGNVDFSFGASAGIDLGVLGSLDASASYDYNLDLGSFSMSINLAKLGFTDRELNLDSDYGSLMLALPKNTAQGSSTPLADGTDGMANVSTSHVSDPFATVSIDFVAVAAALLGIPPEIFSGSLSVDAGPFYLDLDYTLLSEVLAENASLKQTFTFDADAVDVKMQSIFGATDKIKGFSETLTGHMGDKFDFQTPEGEGTFTVYAQYDLHGTLTAKTFIELTTSYTLTMLEGGIDAGIDFADITDISLGSLHLGPLLGLDISGLPIDIPLYENSSEYELGLQAESYTIAWEKFYTGTDGKDAFTLTSHQTFADAGNGNDSITGNGLDNLIYGSAGKDTLVGGAGNDTLDGGTGDDSIDGGLGIDTLSFESMKAGVTFDLAAPARASKNVGVDVIVSIENVSGSVYADVLRGNGQANVVSGGAGNDELHGADGADTIVGGAGNDLLFGEGGADMFRYDAVSDRGDKGDKIQDFSHTQGDVIAINKAAFEMSTLVNNANFYMGNNVTSHSAVPTLLFDTRTANLMYDHDGTGSEAAVLIAHVTGTFTGIADLALV